MKKKKFRKVVEDNGYFLENISITFGSIILFVFSIFLFNEGNSGGNHFVDGIFVGVILISILIFNANQWKDYFDSREVYWEEIK